MTACCRSWPPAPSAGVHPYPLVLAADQSPCPPITSELSAALVREIVLAVSWAPARFPIPPWERNTHTPMPHW